MKQEIQWSRPVRYMAFILLLLLILAGSWYIRSILEPLIISAFIAYLMNPVVNYLTRRTRLSRIVAVNLVFFTTLLLTIGTPSTLTPIFFNEFKQVFNDILNLYDQIIIWLTSFPGIPGIPLDFSQLANRLEQFSSTFLSSLPEQALQLVGSTSLGALWILVILVAVYYLLSNWPQLRNGVFGMLPEAYQPEIRELYRRVRVIWMSYLRSQILLMFIVGVVFTIAWTVIGIPGALVLGVIAGFLTLIPDVGPFIAAILAVGVALLEGSSWITLSNFWVAVIVFIVYMLLIAIKNFWLRPYILGRSVHMSEALVFIFIILATVLWGIMGALLVIPVVASLAVILDYLRRRIIGLQPFPAPDEVSARMNVEVITKPNIPVIRVHRKSKGEKEQ